MEEASAKKALAEEASLAKKTVADENVQPKITNSIPEPVPTLISVPKNNVDNEINKTKAKLAELNTTINPSSTSDSSSSNLTPISTTESSTQMDTSDAIRQNVSKTPPPPKKVEPSSFMNYFTKVNYFNK